MNGFANPVTMHSVRDSVVAQILVGKEIAKSLVEKGICERASAQGLVAEIGRAHV